LIAAHDRAPSHDGGSMWFMLVNGYWLYVRLGGATRGKWGILDGKIESGLMSDLELQDGSPRLCQLRTASVVPYCNKH
jgi:hypothetical protein